jgi:peptidoglycan hydrolase CwlO-like protein
MGGCASFFATFPKNIEEGDKMEARKFAAWINRGFHTVLKNVWMVLITVLLLFVLIEQKSASEKMSYIQGAVFSIRSPDVSAMEKDVSSIKKDVSALQEKVISIRGDILSVKSDVSSVKSETKSIESQV